MDSTPPPLQFGKKKKLEVFPVDRFPCVVGKGSWLALFWEEVRDKEG